MVDPRAPAPPPQRPAAPKPAEAPKPATPAGHIDNRDQDPRHPANTTQPKPVPATGSLPPEDYMTEQEKDALKGQGSSAKEPYPTGDPPPPAESHTFSQGIKGVTDQPSAKPAHSSGPAGHAPGISDKPPKKETP
jgi:hypothetical protein